MKLGVIADIHGNDVALRAVLKHADRVGVDRWWALGDLVLFGPRPAEVLELLQGLPGISMLRGNTDRYVLTGEQPAPHATAADAVASVDLVERYGAMAAGIGWTRGVLDQAGLLASLTALPGQLRLQLPSGTTLLGVHASLRADDGPGGSGAASWLLLEDEGGTVNVTHFAEPFDVDAVVGDLRQRRHPNAEYIASILTAQAVSG